MILDKGYMAMFSDFSLKSLIAQWDEHLLGLNPFKHNGGASGGTELRFDPVKLINSPSAQLQIIGDLAE
jgi:hypothetical protein